tara:strand:- start:331 stop:717 length:387 start_codon:yes stop_codon:yes gene_type:complete
MICQSDDENRSLASIIRDFKTYSSKQILRIIKKDRESRREWMLPLFREACVHLKRNQRYKVWQNGYHSVEIYSQAVLEQKLRYIHMNPVKDKIVERPEDYIFSSARNYADLKGLLDVEIVTRKWYYET